MDMLTNVRASFVVRTFAIALMLIGAITPLGHAPIVEAQMGLPVRVIACDAEVSIPSSASGHPLPNECRELPGVKVTTYTDDGVVIASCVTDERGRCGLGAPNNSVRTYAQDASTLPEGYAPRADVVRLGTYTEFAEVVFINYREGVLPPPESGDATLRIHSRVCPWGYTGERFYADCHDNLPAQSQWVFASGAYAATGTDGNALFRNLPAGETRVFAGQNPETGDVYFFCSETADTSVRRDASTAIVTWYDEGRRFSGGLTLEPGDDITCDWYLIPGLDRGYWSSIEHWLDDSEPDVAFHGTSGDIQIRLFRCPDGYTGDDYAGDCDTREDFARLRATSSDGREYVSIMTTSNGFGAISLSGIPVTDFWITLDGHASIGRDLITCESKSLPYLPETPALIQQVTVEADRWTIAPFGDDPGGVTCDWYLVPTG